MKPRADRTVIPAETARADRYKAAMLGCLAGAVLAFVVSGVVGYSLDSWRVASHERLIVEAEASCAARLAKYSEVMAVAEALERRRPGR